MTLIYLIESDKTPGTRLENWFCIDEMKLKFQVEEK